MNNTLRTDYSLDHQSDEVLWVPIPKQFADSESGEMTVLVVSHMGAREEIFTVYAEQDDQCFGFTLGEDEVKRVPQAIINAAKGVARAVQDLFEEQIAQIGGK